MSRRSSRLASGGYYHSDDESDSSSITTITYRENPVKVFKKKGGPRKKRAEPDVSPVISTDTAPQQQKEAPPVGWGAVSRPALRSPACVSAAASVLGPPTRSPSVSRVLHFSEPSQSTVDSSGYSSSEGPCRRPSDTRGPPSRAGPGADYREWMSAALSRLGAAVTEAVAVVQSRVVRQARSANASPRTRMKMKCGLLLLLILLGVWLLWPWWTSLFSAVSVMKGHSRTVDPQASGPLPNTALDAAAVSAAVEAKMRHVLEEMQLKYELLVAEVKQQVQVDLQTFRQTGLSELGLRLEQQQAQRESSAAGLGVRLSVVEEQLSQMVQRDDVPPAPPAPPAPPLLSPELERALDMWLTLRLQDHHTATDRGSCGNCGRPLADKMADFALESQGASVVSTRCSETYRTRSACVTLFGLPLWYPSESPRTVIQGPPVLLPGKCWAFHGVQGTLVIALSHPVRISHVTLDHLPRYNSPTGRIDSAPKDFQVYGMKNETEEGTLLGAFTYREDGEPTQTFSLPSPTDDVYHVVELRVLSNWGHVQYTCVYRFRVHGQMVQT